jgi:SAM-dependent MidA family methyltransferase
VSDGIAIANELLDALPVHRVTMRDGGLWETYVTAEDGRLVLKEGPLSSARLLEYVRDFEIELPEGAVADLSLSVAAWCGEAARILHRGYLVLIDYGGGADHGAGHPAATLRAFRRHRVDAPSPKPGGEEPAWLRDPGEQDLTASVDFAVVERVLAGAGLVRHASVDQMRFLLALGLPSLLGSADDTSLETIRSRLAATALVSPEGLGGSHRVLVMATPDAPALPFPFEHPWPNSRS